MSINELAEAIGLKKEELSNLKTQLKAMRTAMKKPKAKIYIDHLPTLRSVSVACAEAFHLHPEQMKDEHRNAHLVSARAVYAHVCWQKGIPITYIAKYVNRHHTSILPLVQNFQNRFDNYLEHQKAMQQVLDTFLP